MPTHNNKAPWIVITGLDGTGKTTLIQNLLQEYTDHTFNFHLPYHDFVLPALTLSGKGTPYGDIQTDRLIFATDARLTNNYLKKWRIKYNKIFSQRGWVDNFIHGKVQGLTYQETLKILQPQDLEKASAIIYLNADPNVAFARIKHDHNADKYETLQYMKKQATETQAFFESVKMGNTTLDCFQKTPSILIDTTKISTTKTKEKAKLFLKNILPL